MDTVPVTGFSLVVIQHSFIACLTYFLSLQKMLGLKGA